MCGGGEGCSGENVLDNEIRNRVRFEAADRAASPQKITQAICGGQSGLA